MMSVSSCWIMASSYQILFPESPSLGLKHERKCEICRTVILSFLSEPSAARSAKPGSARGIQGGLKRRCGPPSSRSKSSPHLPFSLRCSFYSSRASWCEKHQAACFSCTHGGRKPACFMGTFTFLTFTVIWTKLWKHWTELFCCLIWGTSLNLWLKADPVQNATVPTKYLKSPNQPVQLSTCEACIAK